MTTNLKPISLETWTDLTYWQRKRIYYLARWYLFTGNLKHYYKMILMDEDSSESLRQAMKISRRDWESLTLWDRRHLALVIFWFVSKNKIKQYFMDLIVVARAFLQKRSI